jgi:hypothetical protein
MTKRVAIVGTADTSVKMAEEFKKLNPDALIYSCNAAYKYLGNSSDLHFELHDIDYLHRIGIEPKYFEHLKSRGNKLILQKTYTDYPQAQKYPLNEILDNLKAAYFNNTIAYMIAYAIHFNPDLEELGLFGVDMAADGEYRHQRPCCEFWLGYALSRNIGLHIPDVCPLVKSTHLYAFEEAPAHVLQAKQKADKLKAILEEKEHLKQTSFADYWYHKGAKEFATKMIETYL